MTSRKYFRRNIHGPGFLLPQAIQMSRKADRRKVSPVQNFFTVSTIFILTAEIVSYVCMYVCMYVFMYCLSYRSDILVVSNEPSMHTWLFKNKVFTKLKLIFSNSNNYYTFSPVSSSKISSWPLPSIHSSNSFWKTDWRDSTERAILL